MIETLYRGFDTEAKLRIPARNLAPSPVHDAVDLTVGACFDDRREFGFLSRRQTGRPPFRSARRGPHH